MPSNKDRLYIALYARGDAPTMPEGEDTYHWALLVGPKSEVDSGRGMRYHAKERLVEAGQTEWFFEERDVPLEATNMLLIRTMIGKVEKTDRLVKTLRKVPIKQGESGWNCVIWVKEALEALRADGKALGTSWTDWQYVRDTTMWYIEKKKNEHRFNGLADFDAKNPPTYDLLEGEETIT